MEPGSERDVKMHEGRDFSLCGGDVVESSGRSGVLRSGGGRLFRSGLSYCGRKNLHVGYGFCGGDDGSVTGGGVCYEAGLVVFEWEVDFL